MARTRRLIVHVGYPKTGTTTLQAELFPRFPGYLGKSYSPGGVREQRQFDGKVTELRKLYDRFQALGTGDASASARLRRRRTSGIMGQVRRWTRGLPDAGTLIVSNEGLASWGLLGQGYESVRSTRKPFSDESHRLRVVRTGEHPIGAFLGLLRRSLAAKDEVIVIVGIRNQVDLLGSHYAQTSRYLSSPGIEDFWTKFQQQVHLGDRFADFDNLFTSLVAHLPANNVCIIPLEDGMDANTGVIQSIVRGTAAPRRADGPDPGERHPTLNQRGGAGRQWRLDPSGVLDLSAVESEIVAHFAPSNRRLEARLGRSLDPRYGTTVPSP